MGFIKAQHDAGKLTSTVLLLLRDFEDDFEFYRHPQGKAGNADYQPNQCFLDAKDISKQVRDSVRDPGLVKEVPGSCYEHSEPDDASHSIECQAGQDTLASGPQPGASR
jgi:hypothetical protein